MDNLDRTIIEMLQKDGRAPNARISRALHVSEGTVRRRLGKLIRERTIRVAAVAEPGSSGFDFQRSSGCAPTQLAPNRWRQRLRRSLRRSTWPSRPADTTCSRGSTSWTPRRSRTSSSARRARWMASARRRPSSSCIHPSGAPKAATVRPVGRWRGYFGRAVLFWQFHRQFAGPRLAGTIRNGD